MMYLCRSLIRETMKHYLVIACSVLCMMFLAVPADVCAAGKQDAHIAYVLKNMSLKKEVVAKFRPLLVQYYEEIARESASQGSEGEVPEGRRPGQTDSSAV